MKLLSNVNLCFIFLLCLYDLNGQTNFRPGYVITNENDTLRGLLDYRGEFKNSKSCDFRENEASIVQKFKPFDIKGYRFIDSKFYVSKSVLMNGMKIKVFLEYLVNGIAGLYYYYDGENFHYFIEKSGKQLIELTNEEEHFFANGHEYIRESKDYIGSLKNAFIDCPQIFSSIDKANLGTKSLIKLTKKYHNYVCNNEKCIVYEKQLPPIKFKFATFVSMNVSSLTFSNSGLYQVINFNKAFFPTIGLQMNSTLPRANEKLSFQVSGEYGKSYFSGSGIAPYKINLSTEQVYMHMTSFKGKAGFKYTYPKGKIRPIVMIGGNVSFLSNKDVKRAEYHQLDSTTGISKDVILPNTLFGYNLDFGIDYHFSTSLVPFFNFSYNSASGNLKGVSTVFLNNYYRPLTANIKIFNINAGVYF